MGRQLNDRRARGVNFSHVSRGVAFLGGRVRVSIGQQRVEGLGNFCQKGDIFAIQR